MTLRLLSISSEQFPAVLFLNVKPKNAYGTSEQKINANGVPLWSVSVLATYDGGAEAITITVALLDISALENLTPSTPLDVRGLRAGAFVKGKYAEFYYYADTVLPLPKASPFMPRESK